MTLFAPIYNIMIKLKLVLGYEGTAACFITIFPRETTSVISCLLPCVTKLFHGRSLLLGEK